MIWGHTQELYYTGTGQVLRGHHKIMMAHQKTTFFSCIYIYIPALLATTGLNLIFFSTPYRLTGQVLCGDTPYTF